MFSYPEIKYIFTYFLEFVTSEFVPARFFDFFGYIQCEIPRRYKIKLVEGQSRENIFEVKDKYVLVEKYQLQFLVKKINKT